MTLFPCSFRNDKTKTAAAWMSDSPFVWAMFKSFSIMYNLKSQLMKIIVHHLTVKKSTKSSTVYEATSVGSGSKEHTLNHRMTHLSSIGVSSCCWSSCCWNTGAGEGNCEEDLRQYHGRELGEGRGTGHGTRQFGEIDSFA